MTTRTTWIIDRPHTVITFNVRYLMMTNVTGHFNDFEAVISTDKDDFTTAEIEMRIKTASVDTHDEQRNHHLCSMDFFESGTYKEMIFRSTSISHCKAEDRYILWGNLTIKDVTKKIKLQVEREGTVIDTLGNLKVGFHITGSIKRSDWGINWNKPLEMGGVMIGDTVEIVCEVQVGVQNSDTNVLPDSNNEISA